MPLKISKKKNIYYLSGKVITPNIPLLLNYFLKKIERRKNLILNIEEAVEIDKNGLNAIQQLMTLSLSKEINFSIIGGGCKEIYDHFYEA